MSHFVWPVRLPLDTLTLPFFLTLPDLFLFSEKVYKSEQSRWILLYHIICNSHRPFDLSVLIIGACLTLYPYSMPGTVSIHNY